MNKEQFDNWFNENYNVVSKKLANQYKINIDIIRQDLSDFYIHCVTGDKIETIKDIKNYLFSFIYYRHYEFYSASKAQREGYIVDKKNISIKITDDLPDMIDDTEETFTDLMLDKLPYVLDRLSLDDKVLYNLYYVQKLSVNKIGDQFGLTHQGISKQLKNLRAKIEKCLV